MNNVTVLRKDKRGVPRPIEQAPALNQSSSWASPPASSRGSGLNGVFSKRCC